MSDDARRQAALETMWQRFPAVADKVQQVYGLRLPRHLAVFCALWNSADAAERAGLNYLMVSPYGLTEYFGDDGLRLVGRDGLDPRLHGRFRRDPAEFVTVLMGGSDGLHYGLWYDDPADFPSFVAHNYARDSAETWTNRLPTLLYELRRQIFGVLSDYGKDGEEARILQPLSAAIDWFAEHDWAALTADGATRWAKSRRRNSAVSIFPALPARSGDPCLGESNARLKDFQTDAPEAADWIARAERELAARKPALALAVGSELHWLDQDRYRQVSRDLLIGAYRALDRPALAEIVEVHTAYRDLPSVDVLVAPEQPGQ